MASPGIFLRIFDIMKKRREKKRERDETKEANQEMMDNRSSIITMTSPGIFLRIFDIMKKRREKKREQYEDEQFKHVMNRHNNDVDEEGGAAPPSGGCRSGRCGHKH
eukprot:gene5510-3725_t